MVGIQEIIIKSDFLPSIEELGGEEFLWNESSLLNISNVFPEIIEILLNEFDYIKDKTKLDSFIIEGLKSNTNFEAFDDAINIILLDENKIKTLYSDIADILISKIKTRQTDQEAFISASALDACVRLALKKQMNKHRLFAELVDLRNNDNPILIRKAIRLIGVCFEHWKELDLIELLNSFLLNDDICGDAYYELGMITLLQAFEATNEEVLICKLQKAKEYILKSICNDEERLDAEVYNKVIDIFLSLKNMSSIELLNNYVEELDKLINIRHKWLFKTDEGWLTPRYTSEIEWLNLSLEIKYAIEQIKEDNSSKPWVLLTKILNAYKASRSITLRSCILDLSQIIEPEINAKLINFESSKDSLIKWLNSDYIEEQYKEESKSLLSKITEFQKKNISDLASFSNPLLTPYIFCDLEDKGLSNRDRDLLTKFCECIGFSGFSNVILDDIYKDIIEKLNGSRFFSGSIRTHFCILFSQLLKFLASRTDMENRGRYKYLFDSNAVESELADDLKDFLDGGGLHYGKVHSEIRDIGGGRVDIHVNFSGYRFIVELKREFNDISRENIKKEYEAQAATYQATNINLGFLVVLDLTPKINGLPNIQSNVWLDTIPPEKEGDLEKNIVVVCIPGNKTSPSKTHY